MNTPTTVDAGVGNRFTGSERIRLPVDPQFPQGLGELGARRRLGRRGSKRLSTCATALLSCVVAARAVMQFHTNGRQWPGASDRVELASALAYVNTLEPDAVIAANWPETVAL